MPGFLCSMQYSPLSYYHYTESCSTKLHQTLLCPASKTPGPPAPASPNSPHLAMASLAILLLLACISGSFAVSSNYYIPRSAQQLVIASVAPAIIPDADGQSAQPFLKSPSGSYAAYLRRDLDDSAGSLGGATCYVQIQQAGAGAGAGGGRSVWESECTPVSGADACDLAFSPVGLEIFAGGHSLWDTGVDADPGTLSLEDDGDMSILSKDGVTVWKASGEPWTGQPCGGAPLPAAASSSPPSVDALSLPSTTRAIAKLVTPPASTLDGTGSTDFSFGDQPAAPPPVDALPAPDLPVQPPVDTAPEQPLAPPPPADVSPDLPYPSLPPSPTAYTPMAPPPADISPDQPLYASPPPAPSAFGPQAPFPPFGIPLAPPPFTGETSPSTPLPSGGVPFSGPSPVGLPPHKQGSPHHDLPVGASSPLATTPSGQGDGGAGLPYGGHGQPQEGVFGQPPPLVDGAGHPLPLDDSSGGWSRSERGRVVVGVVLAALIALCSGF